MHSKTLLSLAVVGLAAAVSTGTDSAKKPKTTLSYFEITNFDYDCTGSYCSWTFSATDPAQFKHHPAVKNPVYCSGNNTANTIFEPQSCTSNGMNYVPMEAFVHTAFSLGSNEHPAQLRINYHNRKPHEGCYFYAFGPNVNTTAYDQAANFVAPETYSSHS